MNGDDPRLHATSVIDDSEPAATGSALRGAALAVEGVSVAYQTRQGLTAAVQDVTFYAPSGSFITLIGPSGCGKSSLLNVIAGFIKPSAGEVLVDGVVVRGPGPDRAVVHQTAAALLPWLNVAENVGLALRARRIPKIEREKIVARYLALVGLSDFAHHAIYEISGGMQQRVALARALAAESPIVLLDEPLGALDALQRQLMQDLLLDVWAKTRRTFVLITHSVQEAVYLSTEVITMSPWPGRIQNRETLNFNARALAGETADIKADPAFLAAEARLRERLTAVPSSPSAATTDKAPKTHRSRQGRAVVAGVLAVLMVGVAALWLVRPSTPASSGIELRASLETCICAAPLTIALKEGFIERELKPLNAHLTLQRFDTGPAQTAALRANALDLGLYGAPPLVGLVANRAPVKLVMVADDPSGGEGLAAKANIGSVRDLVGKTIATPLGTSGDVMLRGLMAVDHLPADKITLVNLEPAAMAAAWQRGDIQAAYIWDPWLSRLASLGGRKLVTDGQIAAASHNVYHAGWDAWVVREGFARAHPQVLRAMLRALNDGALYLQAHPKDAAEALYALHGADSPKAFLAELQADSFPTAAQSLSAAYMDARSQPAALAASLNSTWTVMHQIRKVRTPSSLQAATGLIDTDYLK